ncbi:hypothetical protein ACS0TY_027088 [Phlomoides rotata]
MNFPTSTNSGLIYSTMRWYNHSYLLTPQVIISMAREISSVLELSNSIPNELVVEILTRLPVKSLARFKCVSKPWHSLISFPAFIKAHLKSAINTKNSEYLLKLHLFCICTYPRNHFREFSLHLLMGGAQNDDLATVNYGIPNPNSPMRILGSCNGIVCVSMNEMQLFIWNPFLKNFKLLPSLRRPSSLCCYMKDGFGYEPLTDDYKVVAIFYCMGDSGPYEVQIYSRKTDRWKRIENFKYGNPLDQSAKYARGKFHWLIDSDGCSEIVTLDLATERFGKIGGPNPDAVLECCSVWEYDDLCASLGLFSDNLCLLYDDHETHMDLWVMEEYGDKDSWVRYFTLPVFGTPGLYPHNLRLCWLNDDEIFFYYGCVVIVYNMKERAHRFTTLSVDSAIYQGELMVESLVLPSRGGP